MIKAIIAVIAILILVILALVAMVMHARRTIERQAQSIAEGIKRTNQDRQFIKAVKEASNDASRKVESLSKGDNRSSFDASISILHDISKHY